MSRHLADVRITPELLAALLHFPEGTRIVRAGWDDGWGATGEHALLRVEHPDLPAVPEGDALPWATPEYRRGDDGAPVFVTWGLPAARGGYPVPAEFVDLLAAGTVLEAAPILFRLPCSTAEALAPDPGPRADHVVSRRQAT